MWYEKVASLRLRRAQAVTGARKAAPRAGDRISLARQTLYSHGTVTVVPAVAENFRHPPGEFAGGGSVAAAP